MTYSDKIHEIRKSLNMSLRDFGKLVDCDFTYVTRLEKGLSSHNSKPLNPSIDILKNICKNSGYDFGTFLEETGYLVPREKTQPIELIESTLAPQELQILRNFRQLSIDQKTVIESILDGLVNADNKTTTKLAL